MNRTMATTQQQMISKSPLVSLSMQPGILRRKCACGNHTTTGGECTDCAKKKMGLQRKLTIGASNDPLEQEADRIADQVMASSSQSAVSGTPVKVQRFTGSSSEQGMEVPTSVEQVLASPGQPLETELREGMEAQFGYDFSAVRVHTDMEADQSVRDVNAYAYTVGEDIVFGSGQYEPQTQEGRRLVAHELTHVVQQHNVDPISLHTRHVGVVKDTAEQEADHVIMNQQPGPLSHAAYDPILRRHELPNGTPESQLNDGDWLISDRVIASDRWDRANMHNLLQQRPHEYTQPHERRDFYLWIYNYTSERGFETRWPLAAYLVARGAAHLSYGNDWIIDDDVQVAARRGNQIIFDDVFPKLRALVTGPVLRGVAAQQWDAQTLSEEQTLIQTMYTTMGQTTINDFGSVARGESGLAYAASLIPSLRVTRPHRDGIYHRGIREIEPFSGDIMSIDDRFRYGMRLADLFSTHPTPTTPVVRPPVEDSYASGDMFRRLDTRMRLHRLDAVLNNFDVDESQVIEIIQSLSGPEQRELGYNRYRLDQLKNALNSSEMQQALAGRTEIPQTIRDYLLR